jgi:hypothetical protein
MAKSKGCRSREGLPVVSGRLLRLVWSACCVGGQWFTAVLSQQYVCLRTAVPWIELCRCG